jgi:hypothetical protein
VEVAFDDGVLAFRNLNTVEDFEQLEAALRQGARV